MDISPPKGTTSTVLSSLTRLSLQRLLSAAPWKVLAPLRVWGALNVPVLRRQLTLQELAVRILISAAWLQQPELGKQQHQAGLRHWHAKPGLDRHTAGPGGSCQEHPLPQHLLHSPRLDMSQESCQPCRACSCQADACAGCLGRAQGDGSRPLPPRWANSLCTSMGIAWGACCMSPLAPAMSTGHQSNQLTRGQVAETYCLALSQKTLFLLKAAPCWSWHSLSAVTNTALCPLSSLSLVLEFCAKALCSTKGPITPLAFSEALL